MQFHTCRAVLMINQGPMGLSFCRSIKVEEEEKEQRRTTARRRRHAVKKKKKTKKKERKERKTTSSFNVSRSPTFVYLFTSFFSILHVCCAATRSDSGSFGASYGGMLWWWYRRLVSIFFPFHSTSLPSILFPYGIKTLIFAIPPTYNFILSSRYHKHTFVCCFVLFLRENDETTIMISAKTKYHFNCDQTHHDNVSYLDNMSALSYPKCRTSLVSNNNETKPRPLWQQTTTKAADGQPSERVECYRHRRSWRSVRNPFGWRWPLRKKIPPDSWAGLVMLIQQYFSFLYFCWPSPSDGGCRRAKFHHLLNPSSSILIITMITQLSLNKIIYSTGLRLLRLCIDTHALSQHYTLQYYQLKDNDNSWKRIIIRGFIIFNWLIR